MRTNLLKPPASLLSGVILCAVLSMLLVSCSLKLASYQATDFYGQSDLQTNTVSPKLYTPQILHKLIAPAKLLAQTRLALDKNSPLLAEYYLDTVLHEFGIASRPATSFWLILSNSEYQQNEKKVYESLIQKINNAGYEHFAIAKASNEQNTALAIIAISQDFYLSHKIPKQVKRLESIELKGKCSDDASSLSLLVISPDKHIASEPLYCLDGTFSLVFSLEIPGRYKFELVQQSPVDALERTRLDFYIDVKRTKGAVTISKPANLNKMHFKATLLKAINHQRHKRKLGAFAYQKNFRIRQSTKLYNTTSLEYLPTSKNGNSCIIYRSFASDLDNLYLQSLQSLAFMKYAHNQNATSYKSILKKDKQIWHLTQIICGKKLASSMWIGRYRGLNKRLRYLEVRRSKLLKHLGFVLNESNQQMLDRWLLAESLKAIRYLKGLNGFVTEGKIKNKEIIQTLDEAFVTIWEIMHNDKNGNINNINEALVLPLMQLGIHQYPNSCKTNECITELRSRFSQMFSLENDLSKQRLQTLLDYLNSKAVQSKHQQK